MKFTVQKFSKRFPAVQCACFVMHEPAGTPFRATGAALILQSGAVYIGIAACSPADLFVRSVGRAKAIGRAFSRIAGHRTDLWVNLETPVCRASSADITNRIKSAIERLIAERKKGCGIYA